MYVIAPWDLISLKFLENMYVIATLDLKSLYFLE